MNNIKIVIPKNTNLYNMKAHKDIHDYYEKIIIDINQLEILLKMNYKLLFFIYFEQKLNIQTIQVNFYLKLIKLLNELKEIKASIFIFTCDFWNYPKNIGNNNKINIINENIFKAKNYKVITACQDIKNLNYFHCSDYSEYKNNIFFKNIWSSYTSSFCEYNVNPIKKLLLTGSIAKNYYKERILLLNSNIKYLEYYKKNKNDMNIQLNNNYNLTLNKYFASFSSSVHVPPKNTCNFVNTHIILLKTFEILASGSLLVCPKIEEDFLKKYNIINNETCYLIDFDEDLNEQINSIFNNLDKFNKIRKNGQELAKSNFNSQKIIDFINKITK